MAALDVGLDLPKFYRRAAFPLSWRNFCLPTPFPKSVDSVSQKSSHMMGVLQKAFLLHIENCMVITS